MSTPTQEPSNRLLLQLSDLPWMVIAWVLGLVVEGAAVRYGLLTFSPSWTFWVKIASVYTALGYVSFLLNRSPLGLLGGAAIGLAWQIVNQFLPYPVQSSSLEGLLPHLLVVGWCAVVPFLADRILDPWLMLGPFRWLASHHPRYARLRN